MAKLYMNRFAIEENDQFEIHVKDFKEWIGKHWLDKEEMYNTVEKVMLSVQQG